MKRLVSILALIFAAALSLHGQMVITGDFSSRMTTIKMTVVDSLTTEPISFASVYVKAKNDTIITNFTLTDHEGYASIRNIPYGQYTVTAELMGYKPWKKEIYFRDREKDFGIIKLQEDPKFLEAASITDIATPVTTIGDTVVFNASSYQIGANDMLGDLLKRMPGMEVGADGSVQMNGEAVSAITVGGKTFFFEDPATAVKNLPAAIVDKIKVYDKDSKKAKFTGISDKDQKKVMDITVKKEYKKGWFGNVTALGGSSVGKKEQPEFLDTDSHVLYNGNALVAGYNEDDQLTLIGNAYNAPANNGTVSIAISNGGDLTFENLSGNGLTTAWQGGANLNTDRIKGFETTAAINIKGANNDNRSTSSRTTFMEGDENMLTDGQTKNLSGGQTLSIRFDMENEDDSRYKLEFAPYLSLSRKDQDSYKTSQTQSGEDLLNSSKSMVYSFNKEIEFGTEITAGIKSIGNKEKRSITLTATPTMTSGNGWSKNYSATTFTASEDVRDLYYLSNSVNKGLFAELAYVEPFGENWALRVTSENEITAKDYTKNAYNRLVDGEWNKSDSDKEAYSEYNEYYSSISKNSYQRHSAALLAQFKYEKLNIQAGFEGMFTKSETYSKSYGMESTTGVGEWLFDWAPYVNARYNVKGNESNLRINLRYRGSSSQPSNQKMLPVLDLSNPTRISTGNIYLKPSFTQRVGLNVMLNNARKSSFMSSYIGLSSTSRALVNASWYDSNGIQYSVPICSKMPRLSMDANVGGEIPLESSRRLAATGFASLTLSRMTSYQNTTTRQGMDIESFDYTAFMADFWGNSEGDRFFSGASGFSPSTTFTSNAFVEAGLKYRGDNWDTSASFSAANRSSKYSLDTRSNTNVWNFNASADASYTTSFDLEIGTGLTYLFYRGYAAGYGQSELKWDMRISKSVGAFTFMINAYDILGQTRNLTHLVSDNYTEDQYTNILGRYILAGVKWNFGQMSAKQSRRATKASFGMMF